MNTYEHSVFLDVEKCNGCTTCLKHCPTEAIRIKDGHAIINGYDLVKITYEDYIETTITV